MVRNLDRMILNIDQIVESLLNNSQRERKLWLSWGWYLKKFWQWGGDVDLTNPMGLVAVFEACGQGEEKATGFGSVWDSSLDKVVGLINWKTTPPWWNEIWLLVKLSILSWFILIFTKQESSETSGNIIYENRSARSFAFIEIAQGVRGIRTSDSSFSCPVVQTYA